LQSIDFFCLLQRNLPNKRQFGKQDPYCVVVLNGETRKTRIIKRGGQHPEWDEEVRFTIYEDSDAFSLSEDGTPPPLPPKPGLSPKKIQGGEKMTLACFAADREPDLIGETMVDLNEVLNKGETDGTSFNVCPIVWLLTLSLRVVHATSQGQILGRGLSRAHILVERALSFVHDTSIPIDCQSL
jgi:hypothetical protein